MYTYAYTYNICIYIYTCIYIFPTLSNQMLTHMMVGKPAPSLISQNLVICDMTQSCVHDVFTYDSVL